MTGEERLDALIRDAAADIRPLPPAELRAMARKALHGRRAARHSAVRFLAPLSAAAVVATVLLAGSAHHAPADRQGSDPSAGLFVKLPEFSAFRLVFRDSDGTL